MPSQNNTESEYMFNGYHDIRYTPVPDEFFDWQVQDLSLAELKVLLYIFRRTFGFKKYQDRIALSQFVDGICKKTGERLDKGCGLKRGAVQMGIEKLLQRGYVDAQFYCGSCKRMVEPDEMVQEVRQGKHGSYSVSVVPRVCLGCNKPLYGREQRWFSLIMCHHDTIPSHGKTPPHPMERHHKKQYPRNSIQEVTRAKVGAGHGTWSRRTCLHSRRRTCVRPGRRGRRL